MEHRENRIAALVRPRNPSRGFGPAVLICVFCLAMLSPAAPQNAPTPAGNNPPNQNPRGECVRASDLMDQAHRIHAQGEPTSAAQALDIYRQALLCWQSAKAHQDAAEALRRMAEIYFETGDYQAARDSNERAVTESARGRDVRGQILALAGLGLASVYLDKIEESITSSNRALLLASQLHEEQLRIQIFCNYGFAYEARARAGDLHRAARYLDTALAEAEKLNEPDLLARALLFRGYVHNETGELKEAVSLYERALVLWQGLGRLEWQARALSALGGVYVATGEPQKGLNYDGQALAVQQRLGDRRTEAITLNNMGYAYQKFGDVPHALENYQAALDRFYQLNHETGVAQTSIFVGNMHRLLGNLAKARENYEVSQKLSLQKNDKVQQALSLVNLGLLSQAEGDLARAISCYSEAAGVYRQLQRHQGEIIASNNAGYALELIGRKEAALPPLMRALNLTEQTQDHELEVLVRYNLAHLFLSQGQLEKARSQMEKSLELIESLRVKLARLELRSSYFASVRQFYEQDADILMQMHRSGLGSGLDVKAFEISERGRARSLLESLQESELNIRADADAGLLAQERGLQSRLNEASVRRAVLLANKAGGTELEATAKEIDEIATQYQEVEARIRSNSARYAALPPPQTINLKQTQQLLDGDSMLLEYMLGDARSYLWVITSSELYSFELPPRAQIESQVGEFRKLLIANQPIEGETYEQMQLRIAEAGNHRLDVSMGLAKVLLGPVADKLSKKRLLIVPDGGLQSIPFQSLTLLDTAGSPRVLLEDHEIVYEPSASALDMVKQSNAHRQSGSGSVAIFANPVFEADDPRVGSTESRPANNAKEPQLVKQALRDVGLKEGHIPSLPASREEADAIMNAVPSRTGFKAVDFQASRNTIGETDFSHYRIVHFATHGFIDYQHPELSGLVLSLVDEKGNPQDGFLRMHDIYNLKLRVDLVVLSACNTGLGKEVRGEGLIGLTRGFMYAGARGVVASLWKVDDDATAELMKHFYAGMFQKGLTPAAALRDAQLALRSQKRWESPYYWAAFVIQGEYDQKEFGSAGAGTYTSGIVAVAAATLALVIGSAFFFRRKRKKTIRIK